MIRSEWTKLRTVPSTGWLLLAAVGFMVALSAAVTGSVSTSQCPSPAECFEDTTKLSLTGVWLGQAVVAVFGVVAVTNEYGTRMITTTLAAHPHRVAILLAKAGVVTGTVLAAGSLAVAGSLFAGRIILPKNGFTAANGYPPLSVAAEPTLRAAGGTVLYLGLIGLLSFGIGVIVRDTAGAITAVLALLYLVPVVAAFVADPQWYERLQRIGPSTAGLAIQATVGLDQLPIGPWAGLGVLGAWATAALALGTLLFTTRDA